MNSSQEEEQGISSSLEEGMNSSKEWMTGMEDEGMTGMEDEGMSVEVTCFQTFEEANYIHQCNYYIEVGRGQHTTKGIIELKTNLGRFCLCDSEKWNIQI